MSRPFMAIPTVSALLRVTITILTVAGMFPWNRQRQLRPRPVNTRALHRKPHGLVRGVYGMIRAPIYPVGSDEAHLDERPGGCLDVVGRDEGGRVRD